MSQNTFNTAIVFWCPDVFRGEVVNLGIALISRQLKFSDGMFLGLSDLQKLASMFGRKESTAHWLVEVTQNYARAIASKQEVDDRPLRWEHAHIFHAILGKSSELSCIQWRPASSGLLSKDPAYELRYWYKRLVERPTQETDNDQEEDEPSADPST